eukprot:7368553-Pyramimonas_sp.AAC.1
MLVAIYDARTGKMRGWIFFWSPSHPRGACSRLPHIFGRLVRDVTVTVTGQMRGRWSARHVILSGDLECPCGDTILGPVARVAADKVDLVDLSASLETLVERAHIEKDRVLTHDEGYSEEGAKGPKREKKVKKMEWDKEDNKSNFSNFRNKSDAKSKSAASKANKANKQGDGGDDDK